MHPGTAPAYRRAQRARGAESRLDVRRMVERFVIASSARPSKGGIMGRLSAALITVAILLVLLIALILFVYAPV